MRTIGSKTKINVWFKNTGQLKSKRLVADQLIRSSLETIITDLKEKKSYTNIASLIEAIENIPDMKVYRKDFYMIYAKPSEMQIVLAFLQQNQ